MPLECIPLRKFDETIKSVSRKCNLNETFYNWPGSSKINCIDLLIFLFYVHCYTLLIELIHLLRSNCLFVYFWDFFLFQKDPCRKSFKFSKVLY